MDKKHMVNMGKGFYVKENQNINLKKTKKIAIAVSGVGHIYRGMEGWALSMANALEEENYNFTLFKGAGPENKKYEKWLPCIRRNTIIAKRITKLFKKGGWRLGFGSTGQLEAWSFGLMLLMHMFKKKYDIIHIKQGNLAKFLSHAKRFGIIKTPFVLSNGQIANPNFIDNFDFVQFLSPYEKEEMSKVLGTKKGWFVIPNFVDTDLFKPIPKKQCLEKIGIPSNRFVILTVGAIKKYHKRMDYFIREMAALKKKIGNKLHVIIAGSKDNETNELIKEANRLLGKNLSIFCNKKKSEMPYIYNAADIFTLCSLKEAFGNVYIEAMSCGIPIIHHHYPVTEWIVGKGGISIDLEKDGNLSSAMRDMLKTPDKLSIAGEEGRKRAKEKYSKEIVLQDTVEMYKKIIEIKS